MSTKKIILLLLVLLFAVFVRLYWGMFGGNIVGDEPFSYSVSTPSNLNDSGEVFKKKWNYFRLQANKVYKGRFLKEIFFKPYPGMLGKDLAMMYNSVKDDGHSNFYYSLFRIYNSGLDEFNPSFMKVFGILFNVFLMLFAFWVMFKLLRFILKEDKHIPLAMLIAFVNAGAISCTMFVREYQLQSIFFILATYIFTRIYYSIENKEELYNAWNLFLCTLGLTFFVLSAYYSEVYIAILGGCLLYKAWKEKRNDWIIALITVFIGHLILAKLLYWGFFNFIGTTDFPQDTPFNLERVWKRFLKNNGFMYKSLFYCPTLVFAIVAIALNFKKFKNFKETKYNFLLLPAALAAFWSYVIIFIGHLDYMRYVMAGYPIMAMAVIWLIVNLDSKIWSFLFGLLYVVYSLPLTLHFIPKPIASFVYFAHFNFAHMRPLLESDLPIYLKNDKNFPIYATSEVILYTKDDADVIIVSDMDYFTSKENPNDKFIVVTRIPEDFDKTNKKWYRIARKIQKQDLEDYCMFSGWHCFPITKKDYHKIEALMEPMDHEAEEAKLEAEEKAKGIDKKAKKADKEKKEQTVRDNMQDKTKSRAPMTKWDFYDAKPTTDDSD